jgi:hypothetical protein
VVLFETGELGNPNDPKLRFVLAVLNRQSAPDLELPADETQPDAGCGDVESMRQVTVSGTGTVVAGDSHRQNCLSSVVATAVIHFQLPAGVAARKLTEAILPRFQAAANGPNGWESPS